MSGVIIYTLKAFTLGLFRQRANDIIGFVTIQRKNGNMHGLGYFHDRQAMLSEMSSGISSRWALYSFILHMSGCRRSRIE